MVDRSIKPEPKEEINFIPPGIQKFTIENGLTVYYVKRTYLPIVRFNIVTECGSKLDPEDKKGLSLLTTMMMDEGAGSLNALELADEFELIGSEFDLNCSNSAMFLSLRTLKENVERSLELLNCVITEPHFNQIDFDREKRKLLVRLLQVKDDPESIAHQVFSYLLFCKVHPYAFPLTGYEDTLHKITLDDVKDFYESYFSPTKSALIVVGDIEIDELNQYINKYFLSWKSKSKEFTAQEIPEDNVQKIYLVHKDDAVQSEIRIGHLSEYDDKNTYYPRLLLNNILGGQFSSRINMNLREDKGYTYGAYSTFNYYKDVSYFVVSTSVNIENTSNAINEIFYELNNIKNGVTEEEFEFSRSSIVRKFPLTFESNRQIASSLTRLFLHDLSEDHVYDYIKKINEVTIADVMDAAKKFIEPEKCIIVVVGDREKLMDQLSELKYASIIEVDNKGEEK